MRQPHDAAGARRLRSHLATLMHDISYEVMPFAATEQQVVRHVPPTIPLSVTVTEAKGIAPTLDLAERLLRHGYRVAPHLPARQFTDDHHVRDVLARLREAGFRSVFVIGGDAPTPAGRFTDAASLLHALEDAGHTFDDVGIAGYPEGHAAIPPDALDLALKQKAPMATRILTQICFDATTTARWAAGLTTAGIGLPVRVGIPGPVNRQKLIRISAGLGLGQSARFLRKQQNLAWRLLLPGAYNPTTLVTRLGKATGTGDSAVRGLHVFTFNDIRGTELWRRRLLSSLTDDNGPHNER